MPMIPNDEYWSMRAAKRMHGYHTIADSAANEIAAAYIKSTNYINGEIRKIFGTFWEQSGLTETEARKLLKGAKDIKSLENLKKIIAKVGDADKRRRLMSIVQSPAYVYRIRRFEQLQKDIDVQTRYLADFEQNVTAEHYVDLANEAYNRSMFDIQKGTGIGFSFSRMPTSRIAEIIDRNWSGKMFSERIWGRASNINAVLQEELLVGFMTGRSGRKTAKMIEQRMGVGAMEARRLVRTESTYVANFAELESYKESGVSRYRYVATLDMRTSEVCQRLDGMEFDVADASPGENIPPMHPWCRSTTIAAMDSDILAKMKRRAKDPVTGEYTEVPADMTYAQWIKHVDENHGSGTWETERQKILKLYRSKRKNTTRAQNVVDNGAKSGIIGLNRSAKRRESNIGVFQNLEIPMQKREVHRVLDKYGISSKGLTLKIQRSEKLLSLPFYGATDYNNIGRIDLFPNAFTNEEQLVRTVVHEKCHVLQLKKYGKIYVQNNIELMERQAERFENLYYSILKKRVK